MAGFGISGLTTTSGLLATIRGATTAMATTATLGTMIILCCALCAVV
jgi:hypothetical protein